MARPRTSYPAEHLEWLREHLARWTWADLAARFNARFAAQATAAQLRPG